LRRRSPDSRTPAAPELGVHRLNVQRRGQRTDERRLVALAGSTDASGSLCCGRGEVSLGERVVMILGGALLPRLGRAGRIPPARGPTAGAARARAMTAVAASIRYIQDLRDRLMAASRYRCWRNTKSLGISKSAQTHGFNPGIGGADLDAPRIGGWAAMFRSRADPPLDRARSLNRRRSCCSSGDGTRDPNE
jgi:hypothetical protein